MKFFNSFACIKSLNVMKTNELYGLKNDMNKSIISKKKEMIVTSMHSRTIKIKSDT